MAKRKVDYSHAHRNGAGGLIGDTSMQDQADFNDTGAGVKEVISEAPQTGADPNEDASLLPQKEGAED